MRGFAGLAKNVDRFDEKALGVAGRGLFYAWINLAILGQISFKSAVSYSPVYWAVSICSVVLFLGVYALIALRWSHIYQTMFCIAGCSLVLPVGWLLCAGGFEGVVALVGCVLVAAASAGFMIAWGDYYSSVERLRLDKELPASLIVASATYYVLCGAGGTLEAVFTIVLPLLSGLCLWVCFKRQSNGKCTLGCEGAQAGVLRSATNGDCARWTAYSFAVIVFCAMPRLVRELVMHGDNSMNIDQVNRCIFFATLLVATAILVASVCRAGLLDFKMAFLLVLPISCLGLVVLADFGFVYSGYFLVCVGYTLFDLIASMAILRMASEKGRRRVAFVGAGNFLMRLGLLLGTVVAYMFMQETDWWSGLPEMSLMICALMVGAFVPVVFGWIRFQGSHVNSHGPSLERRLEIVSSRYGLTARELELFSYIAQGRSVEVASREMHIAKSTAATHLGNLYRKMGVKGRQDALDVLESIE